jgi:molybdopterin-guanine dinucleotide biosynthesis protein A
MRGLQGKLRVTLEDRTWTNWLYDLLKPHVKKIVVCNPLRNALLKEGSENDRVDARKLAELLYAKMLRTSTTRKAEFECCWS